MSRRITLFAAFLLLSFFLACNNTLVQEEPPVEEPVLRGTLRIVDSSRHPDSITWNWNGTKGKALLACSEGICKFQANLSSVGPNDTVGCGFWTLGLRTMQGTARLDASGDLSVDPKSIQVDTAAKVLLSFHDSLRKLDEARYPWTYSGLQEAFALAILNRNAKVLGGYPKSWPSGIDTTGLVRRAIKIAIDGQGSLDQIASAWSLSLSAAQAKPVVFDILKERASRRDDSLRLFPPSSLKFVKLVSLGGVLWPDGDTVKLSGRVESDSALARVSIQILRGDSVVTQRFVVDTAPSVSGKSWDLDGALRIRAKAGTEMGSYTMSIQVWDKQQFRILHTVPIKVEPRPDHEGPTIQFLTPAQTDIIEPNDSLVRIRVKGEDASGIDSINIQGRRANLSGDAYWLDMSTPLKGSSFIFIVTAWDRAGNRSDSILQLRRREIKDTLLFELVSPAQRTGNVLPVDSALLRIKYRIRSPYGISDTGLMIGGTIARRGSAPHDTDSWYQDVPVPASGKVSTISVTLTDRRGVSAFHFVDVARDIDLNGPSIAWISPSADTAVSFASSLVEIRVEVKDPSGVDSVWIQGRKAERLSEGRYFGLASVEANGKPTSIHVLARDGQGKSTDSVIQVTRSESPKEIQLIQPINPTGNIVAQWVDTFRVVWKLPSNRVKIKVESESGDNLVSLGDGLWATTVRLLPGVTRKISIKFTDSVAGTQAKDEVEVTRAQSFPVPVVRFLTVLDSLGGDTLVTRDSSLNLSWRLTSACAECVYEVDGLAVKPGQGGDSLVVGSKVSQTPGLQSHFLVISKGATTLLRKEYKIRRIQAPRIDTVSPASSLQPGSDPVEIVWRVSGGTRVWIDGIDQGGTGEGLYRVQVSKPDSSVRLVRIAVADSGRGKDSSSRRIQWTTPVSFHMDAIPSTTVQWDSVQFKLTSVISSAVSFRWEADQGRNGVAKPNEMVSLLSNGRLIVCASLAGFLDSCDTSANFEVRHTNQAPAFERPNKTDAITIEEDAQRGELYLAKNLTKGSKWDSDQSLRFEVKSLSRPGLYAALPKVDLLTGILSFVPAVDSFGIDTLEIMLCDDGGTEHGGKDCGQPSKILVTIKAVNDAPIGLPWSVEVPISDSVVKLAQDPVSSGPGEPFVSGMAFRTSYKSGNFSLASLAVARGSAKDSVKVTPGTKAGLSVYQVVATDLPGPNVLGSALSDTFDLSVKVVDSWSVGGKNIPLSVAFGRTWLTEPLSESGGSDSTGIANSVFHCPTGWVLPDSNDVKKMHNLENGSLASIGVLDGEEVWIQSGGALAIARLAFIGSKVDVSFLRASTKNATLRCVYKN